LEDSLQRQLLTAVKEDVRGSFERGVGDAIEGGDNGGYKPVRRNHQRQYQFFKFQAKNGSEFVQNGSENCKNGSVFGKSGSEFCEFGAVFMQKPA
jgi:hypothetical protein